MNDLIYVDTSVWIAQHTPEMQTAAINNWFDRTDVEVMVCSDWVKTEYASGLAIKRRRGDLDEAAFDGAHREFARLCEAGPHWIEVSRGDFLVAAKLCGDPPRGLRGGDALHLAVAVRTGCKCLLSLDNLLNRNATACGLQVIQL
jgi:uncharacterized protein